MISFERKKKTEPKANKQQKELIKETKGKNNKLNQESVTELET